LLLWRSNTQMRPQKKTFLMSLDTIASYAEGRRCCDFVTVGKIERGKLNFSVLILLRLSQALRCSPNRLLDV
jgi:hypothetical protein